MVNRIENQYAPDYVSPPGETLLETLQAVGISQSELAVRTGYPLQIIEEVINGTMPITAEMASTYQRELGIPAHFWMSRDSRYQKAREQV